MKNTTIKNIASVTSGLFLPVVPSGEVAYLQVNDFSNPNAVAMASKTLATKRTETNMLHKGNILFACKGATYLSVVYNSDIQAVASTAFFVLRLRDANICPDYLCWFLNQPSIQAYFKYSQIGSNTPLIRKPIVEELEIPIVDMDIQIKIVEISKLAEQKRSLIQEISRKKQMILDQTLMNIIKR